MPTKIEELMSEVRRGPLGQELIPLEAPTGWPIPVRKGGSVYVTLPYYGAPQTPKAGETPLYPPFATITVRWSNRVPVEYVNLRFRNPLPEANWDAQAGTFPHPEVAKLRRSEYLKARADLFAMYDEMLDMLSKGAEFPDEWTDRFSGLLRLLMEPSLETYYRALAPKFFDRFLPAAVPA